MSNTNHINNGGPAFPRDSKWNPDGSFCQRGAVGMTLRDWFAGQALAGDMVASNEGGCWANEALIERLEERAKFIWRMADAMIAARNNPPSQV